MRPIDADSLIALVQDSTILGDKFKQAFTAIVKGEPTIDLSQTWIPISESSPRDDTIAMVTVETDRGSRIRIDLYLNDRWTCFGDAVTAWMPKPEPYQEAK